MRLLSTVSDRKLSRKERLVSLYPTLRYQFVMTELVVGITDCRAAFTTEDPVKKEHSRRMAQNRIQIRP